MYIPAATLVRSKGLGVWANGPHVAKNGSREASAALWQQYLSLASFTTLFEMSLDTWLDYPPVNFTQTLGWPAQKLGGYVLDIPDDTKGAGKAIAASLQAGVARGLTWMYVSLTPFISQWGVPYVCVDTLCLCAAKPGAPAQRLSGARAHTVRDQREPCRLICVILLIRYPTITCKHSTGKHAGRPVTRADRVLTAC